jgi:hypothetical protein
MLGCSRDLHHMRVGKLLEIIDFPVREAPYMRSSGFERPARFAMSTAVDSNSNDMFIAVYYALQ